MIYIKYMHEVNIKNLDLNLLVALEALLETSSVTKAAQQINLSQPAMSRALDRLRHVLKDPLMVRSGRGMTLTPRAEALRLPLQEALERVRSVLAPNEFNPATSQASFKIICADYVSQLLMPNVLAELYTQAPGIHIQIENMSAQNLKGLRDGEIDLGLGVIQDGPNFETAFHQPLLDDRFVVIMREDHPLARNELDVEDYAGASHALLSITGRGVGAMDRRLEKFGLKRKIALRLPHFLAVHSVIAKTDLIVTLPERLAKTVDGKGLRIMELPTEVSPLNFTVSQIWHERFHHDPARKWLRSILKSGATRLLSSRAG